MDGVGVAPSYCHASKLVVRGENSTYTKYEAGFPQEETVLFVLRLSLFLPICSGS
jgi:hypothetical protein